MNNSSVPIAESTGQPDRRYAEVVRPTISLRIDPTVLKRVDAYVVATGVNRSRIVEKALLSFLAGDIAKNDIRH